MGVSLLQMQGRFAALLAMDGGSINLLQELAVMVAAYNVSLGQHARCAAGSVGLQHAMLCEVHRLGTPLLCTLCLALCLKGGLRVYPVRQLAISTPTCAHTHVTCVLGSGCSTVPTTRAAIT